MLNKKPLTIFELSILYNEIPMNYKNQLLDPYMSTENNMMKISEHEEDFLIFNPDTIWSKNYLVDPH